MNIDKANATAIAAQFQARGSAITAADVEATYANFDDQAFREKELKRYESTLWDRKSPINGTRASEILEARDDIPEGGQVLLVKDKQANGQVVYFQPFIPGVDGFVKITDKNWKKTADNLVNELVERNIHTEISNQLVRVANKPTGE